MFMVIYYIYQLVCAWWLVNLACYISLYGPLNLKVCFNWTQRWNENLANLVSMVCTLSYTTLFCPLRFMTWVLHSWAIYPSQINQQVYNLQYRPQTWVVRDIYMYICRNSCMGNPWIVHTVYPLIKGKAFSFTSLFSSYNFVSIQNF